jgi:high-affinity Fe2+/Pb2+ permease
MNPYAECFLLVGIWLLAILAAIFIRSIWQRHKEKKFLNEVDKNRNELTFKGR